MKEIIKQIKITTFGEKHTPMDGYEIITNKQIIRLGIDNQQYCCENWGYFISEDDVSIFIGSSLLSIELTDTQLKKVPEFDIENSYEGAAMFVDLKTSKGVLQFVAYTEHNGYYGHSACVISSQLTHEIDL